MQGNTEKSTFFGGHFKLTGENCVIFREKIIHAYQEQGSDLEVVFKCSDGEQRCSRLVLSCVSQFFADQLDARDRMKSELIFNYLDYPKRIIKSFLDLMHLIEVEMELIDLIQVVKFLNFEGKTGESIKNSNKLCKYGFQTQSSK